MRRGILLISLFLCVIILSSSAMAQYLSTTTKTSSKQKDVILSTEDIKDSYKVIGIVSIRAGEVDLAAVNSKLKDAAKELGADYVIGINYFTYSGYIYAYGTAVKIKE
ncbi:MAG: hypothetical protein A3F87_03650 [Omnitrophica WOR_2 bacterium RIFCSPLOWO2_12_FULL_51_24]|nr:MAG: hypothetical protein A2879_01965 [Omnitrophica WOR_2 bacterium RIFCSPHIGHO2_01_FULL_49_10]OGX32825.1 MAG: hypothetical protein A3I43_01085 [Omnitrophica WOR_2 bacterium RIFCSPLOWO2_02_FULL_50_19]OGX42365.1 MAG: hypothetical protein A3F87_03650 [Omnitrophica WOR_2 bacterium RIFCSPLOWO2_12_FULL_51_24]